MSIGSLLGARRGLAVVRVVRVRRRERRVRRVRRGNCMVVRGGGGRWMCGRGKVDGNILCEVE